MCRRKTDREGRDRELGHTQNASILKWAGTRVYLIHKLQGVCSTNVKDKGGEKWWEC